MKTFKILSLLCTMVCCLTIINSCKKTDQPTLQETVFFKDELMARLKEAIKKNPEMGQGVIAVNEKVKSNWQDLNGREITKLSLTTPNRVYECASLVDVSNPPTGVLVSIGSYYDCTLGSMYTFTYNISSPVGLVTTSPFGSNPVSKGRVRVRNSQNVVTYQNLSITPVTITLLGDDPATGNANALYEVKFTSPWIAATYTNLAYISGSVAVYTDCEDLPSFATSYNNMLINPNVAEPLSRVDPVWYLDATLDANGVLLTKAILLGFKNNVGTCLPMVYSDRQRIEIFYLGTGSTGWHDINPRKIGGIFTLTNGALSPFTLGETVGGVITKNESFSIGLLDAYYVPDEDLYDVNNTPKHGNYVMRYRNYNTVTGIGNMGSSGPNSAEIPIVL